MDKVHLKCEVSTTWTCGMELITQWNKFKLWKNWNDNLWVTRFVNKLMQSVQYWLKQMWPIQDNEVFCLIYYSAILWSVIKNCSIAFTKVTFERHFQWYETFPGPFFQREWKPKISGSNQIQIYAGVIWKPRFNPEKVSNLSHPH